MTSEEALTHLATQTAESVAAVLEMFFPGAVDIGRASILARGEVPLHGLEVPAVVSNVSYVDGVTGGNLFATPVAGARGLAAAMMGMEPGADAGGDDLSELEMSAVGEAANQMLAAAAVATSAVVGQEVEIDPPETRVVRDLAQALDGYQQTQWMTSVSFSLAGLPARLVQLVPHAFIVRLTQALEDRSEEISLGVPDGPLEPGVEVDADWLHDTRLRVSGELGRAQMQAARIVDLRHGSIVPLDRQANDPIDLFVNGTPFARGRLVLVDDADWAVRIETLIPTTIA